MSYSSYAPRPRPVATRPVPGAGEGSILADYPCSTPPAPRPTASSRPRSRNDRPPCCSCAYALLGLSLLRLRPSRLTIAVGGRALSDPPAFRAVSHSLLPLLFVKPGHGGSSIRLTIALVFPRCALPELGPSCHYDLLARRALDYLE